MIGGKSARLAGFMLIGCMAAATGARATQREVGAGQTYTTIQACMDAATTGDICNVHAGTYAESITFRTSGVTLQVNSGDTVTVNGTIDILSYANSIVDGFQVTGYTSTTGGIHAYNTTGGIIRNNTVSNATGGGIYVRLVKNFQVFGNTVHDMQGSGSTNGDGMLIFSTDSTDGSYAHGVQVYNNNVYQNHQDAININGNYLSIHDNLVHDNIYSNWAQVHPDGIECNGQADGYVGCQHVLVYNNVVKNQNQNIYFQSLGTAAQNGDIWIFNNVIYNDATSSTGVSMGANSCCHINLNTGTSAYIFNNTIGGTVQYFDILLGDGTGGNNAASAFTDVHIKNNVITNSLYFGVWSYPATNIAELDYNIYYGNSTGLVRWGTTSLASLGQVQSTAGMEAHGQSANPLLNTYPTPTPQTGSPTIGKGENLTSLNQTALDTDKGGTPRSVSGLWTVGAYSSATSATLPNPPTGLTATVN